MEQEQFAVMMSYISTDLVNKICEKDGVSPKNAIEMLYSSKLYSLLEKEDTKLWYYSTDMLYSLYLQEQKTGDITFPDQ